MKEKKLFLETKQSIIIFNNNCSEAIKISIYNNEIVTIKDIASILEADSYELDYLGDKQLKSSNTTAELYKLKY